ncbi:MAG: hypothetical protein QX192_06740 [Methylococcales bacterium]
MNKNVTLMSFTALALVANAFNPSVSQAAPNTLKAETFSFAMWSDMPYVRNGDLTPSSFTAPALDGSTDGKTPLSRLTKSINDAKVSFTIFGGDTKDGSSLCTNKTLSSDAIEMFNSLAVPTVYVPGDNEWTDCHRTNNGSYNNLERLNFLRQSMFNTPKSFGGNVKTQLTLTRQGAPGGAYSENSRWTKGNVVFVTLNIPGSNNNKVTAGKCINANSARTQAECDADNAEYLERDAKNIQFMKESFQEAKDGAAAGVMIVIQGDPVFDSPDTESVNERTSVIATLPEHDGYDAFIAALVAQTKAFAGEVVLVHGDSHFFRVDKPYMLQTIAKPDMVKNLTRVENFGSGSVHWIKVTVTPKNPNVFTFEPMIVKGN